MTDETDRKSRTQDGAPAGHPVDLERMRASFARLMDIYRDISGTADKVATGRCPYKDSRSRCTAKFECRNQYFVPGKPGELAICTGSDKLDYRKAWVVD